MWTIGWRGERRLERERERERVREMGKCTLINVSNSQIISWKLQMVELIVHWLMGKCKLFDRDVDSTTRNRLNLNCQVAFFCLKFFFVKVWPETPKFGHISGLILKCWQIWTLKKFWKCKPVETDCISYVKWHFSATKLVKSPLVDWYE